MISLYDYTDYRKYLADKFAELKERNARFSFRYFNRRAGFSSSGFLKRVMDGDRNLSESSIQKTAKGLKLKDSERSYFENLVRFNQAETHEEKDHYFQKLAQDQKFQKAKSMSSAQYELFSHWYYVAILELVRFDTPGAKDVLWLHRHIQPEVGVREIKKAVKDLKKLKLLEESKKGGLVRKETMISTPDEVESLLLANFHTQMSQMATRAVLEEPAATREFSALTIATSEAGFRRVKKEIQRFRQRLHGILEEDQESKSLVGHLNLQWFRLSK